MIKLLTAKMLHNLVFELYTYCIHVESIARKGHVRYCHQIPDIMYMVHNLFLVLRFGAVNITLIFQGYITGTTTG